MNDMSSNIESVRIEIPLGTIVADVADGPAADGIVQYALFGKVVFA